MSFLVCTQKFTPKYILNFILKDHNYGNQNRLYRRILKCYKIWMLAKNRKEVECAICLNLIFQKLDVDVLKLGGGSAGREEAQM